MRPLELPIRVLLHLWYNHQLVLGHTLRTLQNLSSQLKYLHLHKCPLLVRQLHHEKFSMQSGSHQLLKSQAMRQLDQTDDQYHLICLMQ